MANTEGMSDAAVESLLGPHALPYGAGNANGNTNGDRAAHRRRAIEERMDQSMGERPAARVIRASPRNNPQSVSFANHHHQQQEKIDEERHQQETSAIKAPPIVGDVMERSVRPQPQDAVSNNIHTTTSRNGATKNNINIEDPKQQPAKKRISKFALQQQMMQKNSKSGATATGFPSVHVPLGTFVKPKKRAVVGNTTPQQAARSAAVQPGGPKCAPTDSSNRNKDNNPKLASLQKVSAHDADNMLAQMTPEERIEKAKELQASLSPDTLAFLKRRAQSRTKNNSNKNITPTPIVEEAKEEAENTTTISDTARVEVVDTESPEEKKRVAELLSNIKSYGDLDVAYQAEMGNYSPLQSSEISPDMAQQAAENDPFPLACTLLRSTVPRQNLWAAQVVSKRLQEQWDKGEVCSVVYIPSGVSTDSNNSHTNTPAWPYPGILPASLRCLLDSPVSHTNGYVLHTYVLQALYNLMRLRACAEHVVDVGVKTSINTSCIYQEYFLEDAVPTPPIGSCYEPITNLEAVDATNTPMATASSSAAAYKTGSSSTSAQRDGEAFSKDPMWTLLTRMCMIPRLAQFLKIAAQHNATGERIIPKEALVAICGILAMIAQRAPGPATAIVHHKTLMKNLLEVTVMPRDVSSTEGESNHPYDPIVAIPAIRLLCAIARQSRTSASGIPFDDIVPPLLAMKAQDAAQFELQRWSVILWRTLLRYGVGLAQIPIMMTIAAPHMALGNPGMDPYSLTTEFSSSFANILQCVQVSRHSAAEKKPSNNEDAISTEQDDSLSQADSWLSSSAQQVITQLETPVSEADNAAKQPTEILRFRAGQLQFLSAFLRTSREDVRLSSITENRSASKTTDPSLCNTWMQSCQQVLVSLVKHGLLKKALDLTCPEAFCVDFDTMASDKMTKDSLAQEAAACSFVCSFVSLQQFLLLESRDEPAFWESIFFVIGQFDSIVAECMVKGRNTNLSEVPGALPTKARRGWFNRACFAVVELLAAASNSGVLPGNGGSVTTRVLRKLQFAVIGRLERGDEAMAAILFGQDSSFSASDPAGSVETSSILSSMFFREMCQTGAARSRLDHSFKLKHGPGISHNELGPFKISSLLSDADSPGQAGDIPDFALPVGKLWLWQVLSSFVAPQSKENITPEPSERELEIAEILSNCLGLILELEEAETSDAFYHYASLIPAGGKAYHLLMLCLQPETILRNSRLTGPAAQLLDRYIFNQQQPLFGVDFAKACVVHTGLGKKKLSKPSPKDEEEEKTGRLLSHMLGKPIVDSTGQFDEKELRALIEFSGELCEAYIEYGAQYDCFTKCVRVFLLPSFPAKVRGQTMRKIGDILHLIALPGEDDPTSEECKQRLSSLLEISLAAGLDASTRDPPEFLDAVASVYGKGASSRIVFGYVFLMSVLVQSRHLAISLQPGMAGLEAAKRRLQTVNVEFGAVVIDATERYLAGSDKSKSHLVHATMEAALSWNDNFTKSAMPEHASICDSIDQLKARVS